nr:piwi protein [Cladonema pacificum]
MTGRARGRSRGRGRAAQDAPRPGGAQGGPPPAASAPQPSGGGGGRGRSRGGQPPPQQQAPPQPAQAQAAPPSEQMAQLSVKTDQKEQRPERRRLKLGEAPQVLQTVDAGKEKSADHSQSKSGSHANIASNFFKVETLPNFTGLHQYAVAFEPDINSPKLKSGLLHNLDDILGATRCFDGNTLFMPVKLNDQVTTKSVTSKQGNPFQIKITYVQLIPMNSPSVVQIMNIVFKKQLKTIGMQLIGRNYYRPQRKIEVKAHKLQVWPGISTSILQYEKDVMLCADVSHKVLRQQSVLEFLYDLYNREMQRGGQGFYDIAKKKLIGEIVLTRYNNKTYRVDDIAWDMHPTNTFEKADGSKISFEQYYNDHYQQQVRDKEQPLLVSLPKARDRKSGMTGPILLLPEFCSITGLSDDIRSNFSVMKDLAVHTRVGPEGRVNELEEFMKDLSSNPESQKELAQWNLKFDPKVLRMKGWTYSPEKISQNNTSFTYKIHEADWSRETRSALFISSFNMTNWILVFTRRDSNIANDFCQTLKGVCGPMGMRVADPTLCQINDDNARTYFQTLRSNITQETQIVICIVPNNNKDRYDSIKKLCCIDKPVPSQVVVAKTLSKKPMLRSVCTKIGIQLNCKLGGDIWAVDIPLRNLMVVGFDVYHDSLSKGKSIGGFVASTNKYATRYYSTITQQTSHMEICDQLKVCMTSALKKYHEINNALPERIIVYRDGVGDGQVRQVFEHELPQLKAAFSAVSNSYDPKFGLVIVKKRISTRLFQVAGNGQYSNPLPGTVVDTTVTRPEWFDFFLVSQSVRQGTVSPTHYNIVYDSTGIKPEHYQRLTYKLCHLYYNWPGTIRVPAPCQYAHKLAFLVGQSIHAEPDQQLSDRLYYL